MKHRILSFGVVLVFLVSMCGCNAEKTDVSDNSDTAEISSSAGKTEVVTEYEPESDTKPTETDTEPISKATEPAKAPTSSKNTAETEKPTEAIMPKPEGTKPTVSSDEAVYEVNIAEDEQVIEIEIVNRFIRGNITLTKVDADYPDNKLGGATFEIYKDNNANGKLDDGDELIGTLAEGEIGIYEIKNLIYGHYLVKETVAPEGFLLDSGVYAVFIERDGETYTVENKAGVGFVNDAMRGTLKIVKTSSDGKVEGFSFRVTDANGYDKTFVTDKNGEIVIEGLRIGEYTVSEVANEVSAAYSRPADKKAKVMTDSTTIVEMHNVFMDNPKTGDESNIALWLGLLGLSAVGIGATVLVGFKRRKKEVER